MKKFWYFQKKVLSLHHQNKTIMVDSKNIPFEDLDYSTNPLSYFEDLIN